MKILHITFSDSGGAGTVAIDLDSKLRDRGIESKLYFSVSGGLQKNKRKIVLIILALIDQYILKSKNYGMINLMRFKYYDNRLLKLIKNNNETILHLHWIPGVININILKKIIKNNYRIVWTLHDMWPISGGCNIEYTCKNFEANCNSCPAVKDIFKKLVYEQRIFMIEIFKNYENIRLVAPSNLIYELAIKSKIVPKNKIIKIYNPTVFEGIEIDKKLFTNEIITVGFGAANLQDKNKNILKIYQMIETLTNQKKIDRKNIKLIIFGKNNILKIKNIPHVFVEENSLEIRSEYLKTIDIWINSSKQESFSLMLVEAAKFGISILTSNTGVAPELISQGLNGYIYKNDQELEKYFVDLYENIELRRNFSKKIKENTDLNFNNNKILGQYLKVYSDLA